VSNKAGDGIIIKPAEDNGILCDMLALHYLHKGPNLAFNHIGWDSSTVSHGRSNTLVRLNQLNVHFDHANLLAMQTMMSSSVVHAPHVQPLPPVLSQT
jgi:hypothetical protein